MPHEKRSFLGRDALNFYLFIKIPRQNRCACENGDRLFFLSTIIYYYNDVQDLYLLETIIDELK